MHISTATLDRRGVRLWPTGGFRADSCQPQRAAVKLASLTCLLLVNYQGVALSAAKD